MRGEKVSIADAVKVIEDLLDKSGCGCCADYDEWSAAKARAREFLKVARPTTPRRRGVKKSRATAGRGSDAL